MSKFRILSIPGGGIWGAAYARILKRLADALPGFVDNVQLFAGTSVGGMMALALASGQTADEVDAMFGRAGEMFTRDALRWADAGAIEAKYDNTGRAAILTEVLGAQTLGDLPRFVAVNVFNQTGKPVWRQETLHNVPSQPGAIYPDFRSMAAVEAGLATSAAPTYFPSVNGRIDGGIAENDPSATVITLTQDPGLSFGEFTPMLSQVVCLSIGCEFLGDTTRGNTDTGLLNSLNRLISQLLTGNSSGAIQKSACLLGPRFMNFKPLVPDELGETKLDDADAVSSIQQWAGTVDINDIFQWAGANW